MKKFNWSLGLSVAILLVLSAIGSNAKAQDNALGGEPIMSSIDPSTLTYDYLVDGTLTKDDPINKKFSTLQAAYAAAPAGTATRQTVIGIMPNVYQITGTASTPGLNITKNYITLRGLTNNRRSVVLADNRGNKQGAGSETSTYNGYVIIVNATGFSAENLTFLNYCNVDYIYPGDPSKNLYKRSGVITQAVALQASGDKHTYVNVAFLSRLDTTFLQTTRAYLKNVFIEGTADFIGGGTISVWEDSEVTFPEGSGVMAASGITFIRTKFTATNGMRFYKGAGNPVTLIDCILPVNTPQAPVAWLNPPYSSDPARPNLYSLTYHVKDANGNPAVIVDTTTGPPTFRLSRELSDQEALAFNAWNLLRATPTGTADNWDPAGVGSTYEALGQGSLIYRMAVSGGSSSIRTGGAGATIGATVSPTRAPDQTIKWSTDSKLIALSRTTGPNTVVTGQNTTDDAQYVAVKGTAANGFYVTAWVYVEPQYIDAPSLTSAPVLSPPANGSVAVNYSLNLNGLQDQSIVSWFICDDASGSNPRAVAVSRGNLPLTTYPLTLGDIGKYLRVGVQPKSNISDPGPVAYAMAKTPILITDVQTTIVSPNFRNFVTTANPNYVGGLWTVLGSWTSSAGTNLVNGYGVRVASQGASLLYQQDASFGDMQVDVVMSPEKTAGQGFGSPGSPVDGDTIQKSDIFIKYDPRTKTGYSLRFWRTTDSAEKVMFQLFQIVNGTGSPISDQKVLTGVLKPDTYISLKIIGNTFTATGSNNVDDETLFLQGTITPNQFGGAGTYWSGTTSAGNSNVYSLFQISYPGTIQLMTTATLTKLAGGEYQAVVTVSNNSTGTAQNVQLNTAVLGSANGTPLFVPLGNVTAGKSAITTITFPASAGASGAGAAERYTGSYTGGTFNGSIRATLP